MFSERAVPSVFIGACLAAVLCQPAAAADPPATVSFTEACPKLGDEPPVTAVGVRAAKQPAPGPTQVVILVDTSATQTGLHRQRTLDAVAGLLAAARPEDRFALVATDVASVPLGDGFHAAGSETVGDAVRKLDARTPLGSIDLIAALEQAVATLAGAGPRAIVYIGNGPGLGGVGQDEFARLVDRLRTARCSVSSVGLGPNVNWPCLAALAANSGGMVWLPAPDDDARRAAAALGAQLAQAVIWPTDMTLTTEAAGPGLRVLPARLPPLRADRDSIVLVEGDLRAAAIGFSFGDAAAADLVTLPIPAVAAKPENAYLRELARNARASDGLFLPIPGRAGLELARDFMQGEAAALASLATQARAAGSLDSAARLAEASLRRDPDNQEAALVREVSLRQAAEAGPQTPRSSQPDSADELARVEAQRRIRGQFQERDAAVRIRAARQLLTSDPDQARDDLKQLQEEIRSSTDLDPAARERLSAELEMRIREAIVRAREKTERDLAAERRAAIGRERLRMTTDLQRREEKIKQLTEKYNALVEEGIRIGYAQAEYYPAVVNGEAVVGTEKPTRAFVQAERVAAEEIAREAPQLYANPPIPMTARVIGRTAPLVARILEYDAQNYRTNRDQQRGFMDALHLVDVAGIPFIDEPPIVYPSPARWREITRLREKYERVDLASTGTQEAAIQKALEESVERWEFNDSPLRDVQRAIQDQFRIPVEIDAASLDLEGKDLDTPVTYNTSGIKLKSALRRLLSSVELAYIIKDEVLLITTRETADKHLVVKVYPVADLVLPVDPGSGLNPFQSGGGLGGANSINSGMNMGGGLGGGAGGMGAGGMGAGGMGFCWVAREVYGVHDPRWLAFRGWLTTEAPVWLLDAYLAHGEAFADWLRDRPAAKRMVRMAMDHVLAEAASRTAPGGLWQVTGARAKLAESAVVPVSVGTESDAAGPPRPAAAGRVGLPAEVLAAADLRAAVAAYLPAPTTAPKPESALLEEADRLARLRVSAAELGGKKDYVRAVELLSAAISCGHAEPWMYESLAIALEASGSPRADVERALLSAADFATSSTELMQLAQYLAQFGFKEQAIRICRRVTRAEPAHREAYALAMTLASQADDFDTLRWACPGVLAHDWPAGQQDVATRAARLAKATIERWRREGRDQAADGFQAGVDAALVRDLVVDLSWTGDADVDIAVQEPTGSVCSISSPRSVSGGTLLADGQAGGDGTTHRERYVAAEAFPGEYRILVRRAWGRVAADTVTAEITIHRGTDREQSLRKQIRLGADEHLLTVPLPAGRRLEPLLDAQLTQDIASQRSLGRAVLAQQLAGISDPLAMESISQSRGQPLGRPVPGLPFFGSNAVGYQPIVTTLPEGVNLYARAVVSADRRYVRITTVPLFSSVGQVTTFSWVSGDTQNVTNQAAGAGGGFQGAGGVPGGGVGGGGVGGGVGGGGVGGGVGGGGVGGGVGGGGVGGGGVGGGGVGGGGVGGFCWVAREVYGSQDPRWLLFRDWLTTDAPPWLLATYLEHGEAFAAWINDKPAVKAGLRLAMDAAIADRLSAGGR